MRTTTIYLLALLTVAACKTTSQQSWPATPSESAREATIQTRMQGHERHGDAMRDAVTRGDLDEAKSRRSSLRSFKSRDPPAISGRTCSTT